MFDVLMIPFFDSILSVLGFDIPEPSLFITFGVSAWEWSLYSFQVFQAFLLDVIHVMRYVLCIQFSLIWTFIQWCFAAGRGFYHFLSLAGCEATRLVIAFLQASFPFVRTVFLNVMISLDDAFRPAFRILFDYLHPFLCQEAPIPRSSFWNPFPASSCSAEDIIKHQRDCAFAISFVVVAVALTIVTFVSILAACSVGRSKERAVGVDRGTNTPVIGGEGDASLAVAPAMDNRVESAAKEEQFRELHEQLIRVSQLIELQRGDAVDKDVRIEELTFENRALRQNAIDEKELQSCIVCREEPRRIVLFPCRHLCLCENCNNHHFRHCPYCRTICTRWEKIFV